MALPPRFRLQFGDAPHDTEAGVKGFVAAGSPVTSEVSARMLARGGNAADAAVAGMFTAFLAEPTLTSPGGGGIAVVHGPTQAPETVDFFGRVPGLPAAAVDAEGLDFAELPIDFSGSVQHFHVGRGATAVPGCIPGLLLLHRRHGRLPLEVVLDEPVHIARLGAILSSAQARFLRLLEPIMRYTDGMAQLFAPRDPLTVGVRLRSAAWTETLEWIRTHGVDPLTRGPLRAELLAEWGRPGGLITAQDLDAYEPSLTGTHLVNYRGHEIDLPGYPSVGGSMVGFALKLLEEVELPAEARGAERFLLAVAAQETALRARADAPMVWSADAASHWLDPDHVEGYRPLFRAICAGEAPPHGGAPGGGPGPVPGNTTHLSVVDGEGLCVSVTTSNGETCGVVLPGLGLALNNFLGEEDINPLGWHREPPGQSLCTMMCPTVVRAADGRLFALGTGGSKRIRSAILQVIVNLLDYGMSPGDAVSFARIHRELDGCYVESTGLPEATIAELDRKIPNLKVFSEPSVFFGGVHVACEAPDGRQLGAGDGRRGGCTALAE